MGKTSLVSTMLKGIGLSYAVPTFEAAGIVTPKALAQLDPLIHFEALGVSDPEDRHKLFLLVQDVNFRMKNSKDKKGKSMEAQVDDVISGTVSSGAAAAATTTSGEVIEEEKKQANEGDLIEGKPQKSTQQKTAPKPAPASAPKVAEPRRSKRIKQAATKQTEKNSSKENATVNGSVKNNDQSTSLFASKKKKGTTGNVNSKATARSKGVGKPDSGTKQVDGHNGQTNPNTKHVKANAVFGLTDDDEESEDPKNTTTKSSEKQNGVKKPQYSSSSSGATDTDESTSDVGETNSYKTPVKSKTPKARARPRPESRLQNPGKSMRTGKQLSSIPSEAAAPMSPLVDLPISKVEETNTRQKKAKTSRRLSGGHKRSSSNDSRTSKDSLDELLQSSTSSFDECDSVGTGSDSERSLTNLPTLTKKRPKSFGIPNRARPQTSEPQAPRSARIVRRHRGRTGLDSTQTHSYPAFDSSSTASSRVTEKQRSDISTKSSDSSLNASFTHGGTESESFETKISYLRQDNQEEHEMFCSGADQELYSYDMRIRVIVKKRPVSKNEESLSGGVDVIHPLDYGDYGRILVYQPKTRVDLTKEVDTIPFAYDNVYGETSTNVQIYQRSLRSLILPFFKGHFATVFAYGQTGSGKTYTMMGSNMTGLNAGTATDDDANLGLYYLAALDIFDMIKRDEYKHLSLRVSLFEIYGGKLYDLLNKRKQVKCLEDSRGKVCFPGLTEHATNGPNRLMELIEQGALNRSTGTTSRNADSSRSHAVLQLTLRKDVGRKKNVEHGRLNFIDLAGSERGADTSSCSRATRLEGAEINTSLLALKEVIRALATDGSLAHVPFRGSKLTQVLKDSFVGKNARCCMIACISPDIRNCEQTLNTLRYADRVKERNSETGAISSSYAQPIRLGRIDLGDNQESLQQASSDEPEDQDFQDTDNELAEADEYQDDTEVGSIPKSVQSDTDTAVLDDLLATSLTEKPMKEISYLSSTANTSIKDRAAEALLSTHGSVLSTMLGMVRNEMMMVQSVDADRDRVDDYLRELETIQSTQLDLISKLRTSIHDYVSAKEESSNNEGVTATQVEDDDDSFEDLRD